MSYLMKTKLLKYSQKCEYLKLLSVCPLCKTLPLNAFYNPVCRQSSTIKASLLPTPLKKKKKLSKKGLFSDVIQIADTKGSVKQTRATVKKSSPKEVLSRLKLPASINVAQKTETVTQNAISLTDNSENISKRIRPQLQSFDIVHTQPLSSTQFELYDESQESYPDHIADSDSTTLSEKPLKRRKSLTEAQKEQTRKIPTKEVRRSAAETLDNITVATYIDVCINCDMITQAHNALVVFRSRRKDSKKNGSVPSSIFNLMIHAHARKGHFSQMKQLLFMMREDGVKPTLQTYVAFFYCISKLPVQDKKVISSLLSDIEKDGLEISQLDKQCIFFDGERDEVIKTIRKVMPNYVPESIVPKELYDSPLLIKLNEMTEKRYVSEGPGHSYQENDLHSNLTNQMQIEIDGYLTVKSIETAPVSTNAKVAKMRKLKEFYLKTWQSSLTERFKASLQSLETAVNRKNMRSPNIYPFLKVLNVDEYVKIIMQEIESLPKESETYSLPLTALQYNLGSKVMQRYIVHTKVKNKQIAKILNVYKDYCKYQMSDDKRAMENSREHWMKLLQINLKGPSLNGEEITWPGHIITAIGKFLYNILLQETTFDANLLRPSKIDEKINGKIPAFYNIYRNVGVHLKEEVKPHPFLVRMFKLAAKETITFESNIVPMFVPCLPWTSIRSGGYLLSSAKIIRLPMTAMLQRIRLENTPNKQLWPIFDSLNQLSECAWKINKPVLDVIISLFNNNGDESLDITPKPTDATSLPTLHSAMTKEEKIKVYGERLRLKHRRAEMYSLWCDTLYRLSIANHFRDAVFWFPHNMDFRGRVYPCPPHFNHLGGDVARSLLLFEKGELLGEKGLDWLKIHLINLTGLKKRESLSERLRFADEMMPEIIDSARNPLNGNRWWTKSDEPWQTLACCMEIVKATSCKDPTKYVCHFPIHQDGSCNGLQHYSALGRDVLGSEQVNLHPMDTPQDVYSGVAQLVENERAKDAAAGVEIAKLLEGFVQRKVIKQTVMTTVYGVTPYGARLQILKQLKALPEFPMERHWEGSIYLMKKTFHSIQKMFTATKEIQDWFTESAKIISQVCGQPIEWITPLGLPVVQPYHKISEQTFDFGLNNKMTVPSLDIYEKPNVMKQKNAFAPNFIHSLDSTHMMLTSLYCQKKGIMFVSVHDCFWTHASTVEIMNKICREQFVALHSLPLLNQLSHFFVQKYSYDESGLRHDGSVIDSTKINLNRLLKKVPVTGEFQIENVLNSTYFFS